MKDFIKDFIYCSDGVRERHLMLKSVFGLPIVILLGMFGMFGMFEGEKKEKCIHCEFDGWSWEDDYGWVCCAECNDNVGKPKPDRHVALTKFQESMRMADEVADEQATKIERYQRQLESGVITKAEYEGYLHDLDQLARMDSLRQRLR